MYGDAAREYRHVLKINPSDTDALERLADLSLKNKQYSQAVNYYERLKTKSSRKASVYANLGFAYGELKKYQAAASNYEKAIQLGAKEPVLRANLADTYEKMGMKKKAIALYEKMPASSKDASTALADLYLKEKIIRRRSQSIRSWPNRNLKRRDLTPISGSPMRLPVITIRPSNIIIRP